jgi:hypothetical protein
MAQLLLRALWLLVARRLPLLAAGSWTDGNPDGF